MEISDPKAIRALAHPLRLDLLQILGASGPATAAQCGRVLGVSQASCSFHLRQLGKYGFVVDVGPGRDRRERQWQVAHLRLTVRMGAGGDEIVRGDVANGRFTTLSVRGNEVVGGIAVNSAREMSVLRRLVASRKPVRKSDLENPQFELKRTLA